MPRYTCREVLDAPVVDAVLSAHERVRRMPPARAIAPVLAALRAAGRQGSDIPDGHHVTDRIMAVGRSLYRTTGDPAWLDRARQLTAEWVTL